MNILLLLPILIPFFTAIILIVVWQQRSLQRWLGVLGAAALLIAGVALLANVWLNGIQAVQIGDWPAPFGITLVADLLSALMVVLAGLMTFALLGVYAAAQLKAGSTALQTLFGWPPELGAIVGAMVIAKKRL